MKVTPDVSSTLAKTSSMIRTYSIKTLGERNVFCEYCIHTNIRKLEHTVKNQYICVYG